MDKNIHTRELDFKEYKAHAIKAAKDFHYGDVVISQLKSATNSIDVTYIMTNARHNKFNR